MRSRRFPPSGTYSAAAEPFEVATADGVRLAGHRLGQGRVAFVFCHGFLGWHRKPRLVAFQQELARWFTVFAFDFRGHGESGGISSFGALEQLDVDAVVHHARGQGFGRVVTFGGSLGGVAVIRHAALLGGSDGVVAVSTPAMWDGHDTAPVRRMVWLTATRSGRWVLKRLRVRTPLEWEWAEAPAELIDRIAPTPVVIVHGRDDHYFDEEQAWLLYRRAGEPKRLLLASRFGHAEDGYTPAFARQIAEVIMGMPSPQARATA
jgi:pimeloyl-ACP methyl ester carboxylesterase